MKETKPLILISNDDGITAKGIKHLVEFMAEIGEVIVVAPNKGQSGMGHAITIGQALRLDKSNVFGENILAYECSGTPADCVKLAKHYVLKDRTPDLVVSGINHGSNSSINVIYSGTMSAAIEGSVEGLNAIGFSVCDYGHQADFSHTKEVIQKIVRNTLANPLPKGITLNVNIPKKSEIPLKGIKICRQTKGRWAEEFDERIDPHNRPYFWLTGKFVNDDLQVNGEPNTDTDEWALKNNYVSIVPCSHDLTAYPLIAELKDLER